MGSADSLHTARIDGRSLKVKANTILEEAWRVKDALAARAGGNVDRLCEQTREWASGHHRNAPVAQNYAELARILESGPMAIRDTQAEE